jgi:hypothetical protein
MNFRDTYGFDPDDYNGSGGGLPGMLWRAMQQQGVLQPGVAAGSSQPGVYNIPGALLGGLLALQGQQQPPAGNNAEAPPEPQDPNFRRLVRVTLPARSATDPSDNRAGSSGGSFQGGGAPASESTGIGSPYPARAPQPGDSAGVYGDQSGSSSAGDAPTKMAQVVIPGRLPLPWPVPPVSQPPISLPDIPDSWKTAWKLLQTYARISSGIGGGRGDDKDRDEEDDKNQCVNRWLGEEARCGMFKLRNTNRWRDACEARAQYRLRLCHRNGGKPDPNEPDEYGWHDIPNDPAGR